jgi:hypothetical protein
MKWAEAAWKIFQLNEYRPFSVTGKLHVVPQITAPQLTEKGLFQS